MVADLIIAAVLVAALIIGIKQGLLQALAGVAVVVLSFLGAGWAAATFSNLVASWLRPLLQNRIQAKLQGQSTASAGSMLSQFGFSGNALEQAVRSVAQKALQTGQSLLDAVADSVIHSVAYAVVYVVAFLILLLVLRLVAKSLNLAAELPGLKTVNSLGGAVLGLAKGLLLVFFGVWALQKLQLFITPELMEQSALLPFFINNSPITLLASLMGESV